MNRFFARDNQRHVVTSILLGVLLAIFLITRLSFLMRLPPFIDEGLHSYYVRVMESGIISAGAGDGKWLSILILYGLSRLPVGMLLVIRLASVASGALTLIAIIFTGRALFDTRAGLLAALFYIFLPYGWFYSRLGLTDGIAVAFGAWTLLVSILAVRSDKGPYSLLLTALLLAALLAKASSMLFILFPLLALLLLTPPAQWRLGLRKILPALLAAAAIAIIMLSQGMGTAEIVHKTVETRSAGLLEQVGGNVVTAAGWYWTLLTPPVAILTIAALLWLAIWRRERGPLFLLSLLVVSLAPYVLTAATWYPRYLLFTLVPLALSLGYFWRRLMELIGRATSSRRQTMLSAILLALAFTWPALYGLRLAITPEEAHLPTIVRRQFISAWTAGYGVEELARFLEHEVQAAPAGLLVLRPDHLSQVNHGGLELFLPDDDRLQLETIGGGGEQEIQAALTDLPAGRWAVFVFDSTQQESLEMAEMVGRYVSVSPIWRNTKPGATGGLEVWELNGGL